MHAMKRQVFLIAMLVLPVYRPAEAQAPVRDDATRVPPGGQSLVGYDFAQAQAAGMQFERLDLRDSKWQGADLRGSRFLGCNVQGADFSGASLRGAIIEDSNLADAVIADADLSGALLRGVNLAGASLANCRLDGTSFQYVRLSSNGGTHGTALTLALRKATGLSLSRPWTNALSGDAFCFTYNTELPSYWPCRPYYQHPVLGAGRLAGVQVEPCSDLAPLDAYTRLKQAVVQGMVCMIGVRLAEPRILDADQPSVWALVQNIEKANEGDQIELLLPPLGTVRWNEAELKGNWEGPWQTLYPAGHPNSRGKYPLIIITPTTSPGDPAAHIAPVMDLASRMIADPRTYGPLLPGLKGLAQLAEDLRAAGSQHNVERMGRLGAWSLYPRSSLAGARLEASQFCTEAAALAQEPNRSMLLQIAAMFETEATLLQDVFPDLVPQDGQQVEAGELAARFLTAAEVIEQVRASELRIAGLIENAG